MDLLADLQIHSKHARAVSRYMELPAIAGAAARKGIGLVATGDWQHPKWFTSIKEDLTEVEDGVYALKEGEERAQKTRFLLVSEISCMYPQGGKFRRVHHLIFSPTISVCQKIITALKKAGADLASDGRPVVRLSSRALLELLLEASPETLLIPAHVWTPWFGLYGSKTGFDSLQECFGDLSSYIYAVETGLSSDPAMNWQIKELDSRAVVSFSDAHSAAKLGREATAFTLQKPTFSYGDIVSALKLTPKGNAKLGYTLEFFPEEGKYHWSGHRAHGIRYSPAEEKKHGLICPICKRPLTAGVAHRVAALASRSLPLTKLKKSKNDFGVTFMHHPTEKRPPFVSLVPLLETLQEVTGSAAKAGREYDRLTEARSEFDLLLKTSYADLTKLGGERFSEAIQRVRERRLLVDPGYDGIFGTVKIFSEAS